jgi:hypothetical protein
VTAQEQIAKLESLLERIRRNAEKPRPVRPEPARAEPVRAERVMPAGAVPAAAPPAPAAIAEPSVTEEVSLESLGATEPKPSAPEPARERVQSADMDDLEIVEIGSDVTDLSSVDEPVPESAPRPAVQSVEVELEPPIKTPPPESGRQAVTPPPAIAEPQASDDDFDDDDLMEPDLSGAPISLPTPGSPTMAQLGDTVQIQGADAPATELELAAPKEAPVVADSARHREVPAELRDVPSRRVDPLAATVPDMRTALSLAQTLPDAKSPFADAIRATTEAKAETPAQPEVSKPVEKPPIHAPSAPELVVERPPSRATHAAEVVVAQPRKVPGTFLELLDASLELHT